MNKSRREAIREVAAIYCIGCKRNDPLEFEGAYGFWHDGVKQWCKALRIRRAFPEAFTGRQTRRWTMTKQNASERLHSLLNKPLRTCISSHECCFCDQTIRLGDLYRDGGYGRRAHQNCMVKLLDAELRPTTERREKD